MRKRLAAPAPETAVFLLLPLLLAAGWGLTLPERAYVSFAAARGLLLAGSDLFSAPLWTGLAAGIQAVSLPLPPIMAALSALGWSVTALLLYQLMNRAGARIPALLLSLLLLTSPLLPATLATAVSWQTAVSLWAVRTTVEHRWRQQSAALLLLPLLMCNWHSLLLAVLLLAWRRHHARHIPYTLPAAAAALFLLAGGSNRLFWHRWLSWPTVEVTRWLQELGQLGAESDFYGPALLLAGAGLVLLLVKQEGLPFLLLLWGEVALFNDTLLGAALILLCTLLGVQALLVWLQSNLQQWVASNNPALFMVTTSLVFTLPLLLAHTGSLRHRYRARPLAYTQLLAEAGHWLHQEASGEEAVFGSAQVAYHASLPWSGTATTDWPTRLQTLINTPPDYVVTGNTLPWSQLSHTGWFQERYRTVRQFTDAQSPLAPVTVWAYRAGHFDRGVKQPIRVRAENGLDLIGYQYWPQTIGPGDAFYVTLEWQVTRPLTQNVNTVMRLSDPVNRESRAQRTMRTPRSVPPAWLTPGMTFPERFVLTTTRDIPVGAYRLNLSLFTGREDSFTRLFQNEDSNPLDRIQLGYVAVPWEGKVPQTAVPVQATFGEQISLPAYTLDGSAQPGSTLSLTLYWQALRPPDANYTVFVHLLDPSGQYVTGHDAPPRNGTYPTQGWQPDRPLPDEHPLPLPPDLAPGTYRLLVGLYLPATGVRLPVVDAAGVMQPNQALQLQTVQIEKR